MAMSHATCSHPKTPAARAACRKVMRTSVSPNVYPTSLELLVDEVTRAKQIVDVEVTRLEDAIDAIGEHMTQHDARRITNELLAIWDLDGWRVQFDSSRRRAGQCRYMHRVISLSAPLIAQRSYADTLDTITHEIAHALTPGEKHSPVWAAKHRELGGNGKRCFEHEDDTAPWIGTCVHGKQFSKYREPKRLDGWLCKCVRGKRPTFSFAPNPNLSR